MRPLSDAAEVLSRLYREPFGSKPNGRYKISREDLKSILGTFLLTEQVFMDLHRELLSRGLVITNLDCEFSVMEVSTMQGYRKVPEKVVRQYLPIDGSKP